MTLNARTIKLGRLFMLAWLAFFMYPIVVIIGSPFAFRNKVMALTVLLLAAAVWAWFWTRIVGGPDRRFATVALILAGILFATFTAMTPPQYGTMMVTLAVMVAVIYPLRISVLLVIVVSLAAGVLDLARGTSVLQAYGEIINDGLVGIAALAGRLLVDTNRQLSLAREQIARLAVGEERLRFARDLHDLLGHSLSVIALKSELAGRLIGRAPGLAQHEVADIERVARESLREVREAVTGYRKPTLAAELAGAREALAAAGIVYQVEDDSHGLPPAVEAVLGWAVREGATNVIRHSQATRCSIRISQRKDEAVVDVVDDGRGVVASAGSGLNGLNERVRERGGTVSAEPLPHEGFRLRVRLPLEQSSLETGHQPGRESIARQA